MFGSTGATPPPSADFFDAFAYTMDFPTSQSFQYPQQHQQDGGVLPEATITRMDCEQTDQMSGGQAPPTPEILSSFFNYAAAAVQEQEQQHHQQQQQPEAVVMTESQMYAGPSSSMNNCIYSSDISSSSTFSDFPPTPSPGGHSSGLSVTSPVFGQSRKVDSVKATRSQLIKEGLKLTIQHKRRARGLDSPSPQALFATSISPDYAKEEFFGQLTPEDEDRRRRRRERNKVAATKCRNKKKERTLRLAVESTTLESSNQQLKDEIEKLEDEKKSLLHLLRQHLPRCGQMGSPQPRSSCAHTVTNHCAPL